MYIIIILNHGPLAILSTSGLSLLSPPQKLKSGTESYNPLLLCSVPLARNHTLRCYTNSHLINIRKRIFIIFSSLGSFCQKQKTWNIYLTTNDNRTTWLENYQLYWFFKEPVLLFKKLFHYLCTYFWLAWVFTVARGLSLVVADGSYSLAVVFRLLIKGTSLVEHESWSSVGLVHGVSWSAACSWTRDQICVPCIGDRPLTTGPLEKSH